MKIIRILVLLKYSYIGTEQAIRPHMVRTLKLGGLPVEDDVRNAIVVFFFISLNILLFCALAMAAMGLDIVTAITSVIATLNNIGPGLARVGAVQNFAFIPTAGKLLLSLCMVLGRLELITILVLFMPSFWKAR